MAEIRYPVEEIGCRRQSARYVQGNWSPSAATATYPGSIKTGSWLIERHDRGAMTDNRQPINIPSTPDQGVLMRILHDATNRRPRSVDRLSHRTAGDAAVKAGPPRRQFTPAFLGYGEESDNTVIEPTHNWGVDHHDIGNGYGHIAIEVDDVSPGGRRYPRAWRQDTARGRADG